MMALGSENVMRKQTLLRLLFGLACGAVLAGCVARRTPVVEPTPSSGVTPTQAPAPATAAPVEPTVPPTVTRPPAPTPEPTLKTVPAPPQPASSFFFGVPAGDLYAPAAVAVDAAGRRAYVFGSLRPGDRPALSTVDLSSNEVLRVTPLRETGPVSAGRVLISPAGDRVYVVDRESSSLMLVEPAAGALEASIDGVEDAALSPDGKALYAVGDGVRAFDAADLSAGRTDPLWEASGSGFERAALHDGVLAATMAGAQPALRTFDAATGRALGNAPLPATAADLARGPDGGWTVRVGYPPQMLRFDASLRQAVEAEAPYGSGLFYDAPRRRYLMAGPISSGAEERGILALDEIDLKLVRTAPWPTSDVPQVFAAYGDDGLLGVSPFGKSRLTVLDAQTLSPAGHTILGVHLTGMALDEVGNELIVVDDQDRIHLLGLPDGKVRDVWDGSAPIALDAANGRLYANRSGGVAALDTATGSEVARFPQNGMPGPDPSRDRVYIEDRGVTIYDRQGRLVDRLESTFPLDTGLVPNPGAEAARVNPVTGALAVVMNNGASGSSNRSYLELYPPGASVPITVPGFFSFVSDLAFDATGNLYASYSPANNLEALQRLDSAGREAGRLGGRTGALALDSGSGTLYAGAAGALARVDAATVELTDVRRLPVQARQLLLHAGLGRLYARLSQEPRIAVLDLDALQPFDFSPIDVSGLPEDLDIQALDFAVTDEGLTLFATSSVGEHYRARVAPRSDGSDLRWQKLPVGSLPVWGQLTVAGGALFHAGEGSDGADGVFRSRDGGDTWELISAGLVDLRPAQPVVALRADTAYFAGRTGGVFAWRPGSGAAGGRWERILGAPQDHEWQGDLSLAPDGTLFLHSWGRLQRSTDGGQTWSDLPVPADSGKIAGFDPGYVKNQTLFTLYCSSEACQVTRSRDGGQTQEPLFSLPAYSPPLELLADDESRLAKGGALYLYRGGYPETQLYRSLDRGATWQKANLGELLHAYSAAIAPDGRLWLSGKGSLQVVDPGELSWSSTDQ
jgi:DNA-binding beta-propeller fold protein YncE